MENKHGATSWDEINVDSPKERTNSKDLDLQLENGDNVVRVLTKPHQYAVHTLTDANDKFWGKIWCSKTETSSCPLCEENHKVSHRWYTGVIDWKTQSYKILDMSVKILKDIQSLTRDEDWGNPVKYDITIKVNKSNPSAYYSVSPKLPKPLSATDLRNPKPRCRFGCFNSYVSASAI